MNKAYGVVIAQESKMIRRIILDVTDEQLNDPSWCGNGEILLKIPGEVSPDLASLHDHIEKTINTRPPNPRCAVIAEDGTVTSIVAADPALDSVPGFVLINHVTAEPGDKLIDGALTKKSSSP